MAKEQRSVCKYCGKQSYKGGFSPLSPYLHQGKKIYLHEACLCELRKKQPRLAAEIFKDEGDNVVSGVNS